MLGDFLFEILNQLDCGCCDCAIVNMDKDANYCPSFMLRKYSLCQGTPAVVPTRVSICVSALNKGGSGDPGARSIVGHTCARTGGI
jgi:hypothetical protein